MLHEEIELQTVQLVRLVPDPDEASLTIEPREKFRRRLIDVLPFTALVIVPTLLAAVYFVLLAAPRYLSEVHFVVRTPGSAATSEIASIVQGTSVMRSADDAYVAKEYMLSQDAMNQLIQKDGLLAMFAQAGADVLWRYPMFGQGSSDGLAKHYADFVKVDDDQSTGVDRLSVQAFDPADAQRLAGALLDHTEVFLNGLNTRAQRDAIDSALRDVDAAKQSAYDALAAVTSFRNQEETVDPTKASAGIVASISALSLETATSNARLAELMKDTPQSPEITVLRTRITALQDQIVKQRQLLGGDTASLAPRIERYERLLLDQQFAEKAFISALGSLEAARVDATRQRVFLERVTQPDRPDEPAYPYRVGGVFATLALGLMVWRIANVVGKDTRDHGRR